MRPSIRTASSLRSSGSRSEIDPPASAGVHVDVGPWARRRCWSVPARLGGPDRLRRQHQRPPLPPRHQQRAGVHEHRVRGVDVAVPAVEAGDGEEPVVRRLVGDRQHVSGVGAQRHVPVRAGHHRDRAVGQCVEIVHDERRRGRDQRVRKTHVVSKRVGADGRDRRGQGEGRDRRDRAPAVAVSPGRARRARRIQPPPRRTHAPRRAGVRARCDRARGSATAGSPPPPSSPRTRRTGNRPSGSVPRWRGRAGSCRIVTTAAASAIRSSAGTCHVVDGCRIVIRAARAARSRSPPGPASSAGRAPAAPSRSHPTRTAAPWRGTPPSPRRGPPAAAVSGRGRRAEALIDQVHEPCTAPTSPPARRSGARRRAGRGDQRRATVASRLDVQR